MAVLAERFSNGDFGSASEAWIVQQQDEQMPSLRLLVRCESKAFPAKATGCLQGSLCPLDMMMMMMMKYELRDCITNDEICARTEVTARRLKWQ